MAEIGKNIIENLTTAMYENSYTVYREYIQNSADSIDRAVRQEIMESSDAMIDINIEYGKRRITIYDNAAGISQYKFYKTLTDIADSEKDPTREKGFRGIGRLAGLAYCDKLIFRTSAKGEEDESIMEWDGIKLRKILEDMNAHPSASDLIDDITKCTTAKVGKDEHFFEVIMEGITPESDDLLNVSEVKKYLQAVAPVPYEKYFIFRSKIYEYAKKYDLSIDDYNIKINGNQLFKPYTNHLYVGNSDKKSTYDEISDIEFKNFTAKDDGRLLAWMWFGISKYEKQIPVINQMRGIRVRKDNIQIGDEETLSYPKFYKEPRGNCYFVGELFVVDSDLRPNARRDYFNRNATLSELEAVLKPVLYKEFYDLYHYASKVRSSLKKTFDYQKREAEYEEKLQNSRFVDKQEMEDAKKELEVEREKAEKAKHEIELRQKDAEKDKTLKRVFTEIETVYRPDNLKTQAKNKSITGNEKSKKYLTQTLSKYNKREQKLIARIYQIIKAVLPKDMADMMVEKIQEELNK